MTGKSPATNSAQKAACSSMSLLKHNDFLIQNLGNSGGGMHSIIESRQQLAAFLTTRPPRKVTTLIWRSYLQMKKLKTNGKTEND